MKKNLEKNKVLSVITMDSVKRNISYLQYSLGKKYKAEITKDGIRISRRRNNG